MRCSRRLVRALPLCVALCGLCACPADDETPAQDMAMDRGDGQALMDWAWSGDGDGGATRKGYHPGNDGKCRFARATRYPIARKSGVPQGTCSFGPVADQMPKLFVDGYVTAPNEYFYNKSPALAGACGECYEVTGSLGTLTVMVADICDIGCCENCRGDVVAFDIEAAHWQKLVDQVGGHVSAAYRWVPCPVQGSMRAYFTSGYQGATRFRLVVYNHRVGVKSVEVKGSAGGATKGQWTALVRTQDNYFDWTGRGDVGLPITLRVTSEQGQVVELSQMSKLTSNERITAKGQFDDLLGSKGSCSWPGPEPGIFSDSLGGILGLTWRDWGSYRLSSGKPDYSYATSCHAGSRCIDVGPIQDWGAIQIGYPNTFEPKMFSGVELWARTASGTATKLKLFVTGKDAAGQSAVSDKVSLGTVTSSWQRFFVPFSGMTGQVARMRVVQVSNQSNQTSTGIVLDDLRLVPP